MRKNRINVSLDASDKKSYSRLTNELKKELFKPVNKNEYGFEGNISIIEVNGAFLRAAARSGNRYPFTVVREKTVRL